MGNLLDLVLEWAPQQDQAGDDAGIRDAAEVLEEHVAASEPLPDIVTFAEDPRFLGRTALYPRQRTLLRLMFLEVESMTEYDLDVIGQWMESFYAGGDREGLPPDTMDRVVLLRDQGYPHFREVMFVGGRRGGKGHIGAIAMAYLLWGLCVRRSPQRDYGIDPNKELVGLVAATSFDQARDNQFADLYSVVTEAPCFTVPRYRVPRADPLPILADASSHEIKLRTPADHLRQLMLSQRDIRARRLVATVQARAITSNARAGRGVATSFEAFDEFAHMESGSNGPRTAEEVYSALTPALDQLGKDAFIYIPTSPYSEVSPAHEVYEDSLRPDETTGMAENPEMLCIQLASWSTYKDYDDPKACAPHPVFVGAPSLLNDLMLRIERRNPEKFRVERRAQWAKTQDAYLPTEFVDWLFEPPPSPDGARILTPQAHGIQAWVYRSHVDPSKSQHNFAFVIGHTEPLTAADEEGKAALWAHVLVDYIKVWKPEDYDDHVIPYDDISEEIAETVVRFPTMSVLSFDNYGGFATVKPMQRSLRNMGSTVRVVEKTWTQASRAKKWERLKTALGLRWVHSYRDAAAADSRGEGASLLERELRFLQEKNGKVQPQTVGPCTTDDVADAFATVASELLADQLDRLGRRENLAQARLAVGAPGGYGPGVEAPPDRGSRARTALKANARARALDRRRRGG